jgi:hypothetical protein
MSSATRMKASNSWSSSSSSSSSLFILYIKIMTSPTSFDWWWDGPNTRLWKKILVRKKYLVRPSTVWGDGQDIDAKEKRGFDARRTGLRCFMLHLILQFRIAYPHSIMVAWIVKSCIPVSGHDCGHDCAGLSFILPAVPKVHL